MSVVFENGYSIYNGESITDKNIVELVGMDTYNTLQSISPELYTILTTPSYPTEYCYQLINSVIINNNLLPKDIKRELVISYSKKFPSASILPLVDSSTQPLMYSSSFISTAYFILLSSIFFIFVGWIVYLFLTKDFSNRKINESEN